MIRSIGSYNLSAAGMTIRRLTDSRPCPLSIATQTGCITD